MKKQRNLLLARNIFTFCIIMIFTIIIVSEKRESIMLPKVEKKIIQYIEDNYNKESLNQEKIQYKNNKYMMKLSSTENNKRYFYIYYSNKKITDTYQEDYIKGKSILTTLQKELEKEIQEKTNTKVSVEIPTTLDQFTDSVRERIINEENLLELKIYILKEELQISEWTEKQITEKIESLLTQYKEYNINPKYYILTITNQNEITESIEISNLTSEFIINSRKEEIISDIINDRDSILLKDNKITYKYKN